MSSENATEAGGLKIAISGASGFVGSALVRLLTDGGHSVVWLVRGRAAQGENEIAWDPAAGEIDARGLAGVDAVVHLAGESISSGRWTAAKKKRIRESRVKGTELLARALAGLDERPRVLASASAIGFYGDRGDAIMREDSPRGEGFLADVCHEWEEATAAAREAGIRTVNMRIGVVLGTAGGALSKMLLPFKLGLGGVIGGGRQYMSWIALDDLIGAIKFVLATESLSGAVNLVAPRAATNREFTKTLGRVLGRPTLFPMPAFAARLAFGEMADELLLSSTRVEPVRLGEAGFSFAQGDLEAALRQIVAGG